MSHQITSTNFQLSSANQTFAEGKLQKVERFIQDVGDELSTLRLVINKGPRYGFVAKFELTIPGGSFVAVGTNFSFEATIDEAVEELLRQVSKHKGKSHEKNRKVLRRFKNWLFFSKMT